MRFNFAKKRGFNLLELLATIAIIAMLAALLLPVLSHAKNQAAKSTDLNNLRQVMIAMNIYTGENHDELAWPNWDYGHAMPDGTTRAGWLYKPESPAAGTNEFNDRAGLLWESLHGGKVLFCPMDQPDELYPSTRGGMLGRAQQLSSYIMNGAVSGFRSGYHSNALPVTVSQMQPGDCLLFEADERTPFAFNDGSSWPSEGISRRHSLGATQSSMDGSSSYVRDADWLEDVLSTNKNRLWCYPKTNDGGDPVYGHVLWNWSF